MNTSQSVGKRGAACVPVTGFHSQKMPAKMRLTVSSSKQLRRVFAASNSLRVSSRSRCVLVKANYGADWSTPQDAYLTLGLAHCFEKNDVGKVVDCFVIEPISANSLECMANGAKTCFKHVFGATLGDVIGRDRSALPQDFEGGVFCENFETRAEACARTWMRPHAVDNLLDLVPLGQVKSSFNYDITDKRVLNMDNVVNDDDNIKQDISIDVYGRSVKAELQKDAADGDEGGDAPAAAGGEEEDELDSLLAA